MNYSVAPVQTVLFKCGQISAKTKTTTTTNNKKRTTTNKKTHFSQTFFELTYDVQFRIRLFL